MKGKSMIGRRWLLVSVLVGAFAAMLLGGVPSSAAQVSGATSVTLTSASGYVAKKPPPLPKSVKKVNAALKRALDAVAIANENPKLSTFEAAVDAFGAALRAYNSLPRALKLKYDFPLLRKLPDFLAGALRKLADAEHGKCVNEHDIIGTGMNIDEAVKLMEWVSDRSPRVDSAMSYATAQKSKCEHFELDYNSQITYEGPGGSLVVRVRVEGLPLNRGNNWTNEEPLDYWFFQAPPICSWARRVERPFKATLGPVSDWYKGSSPPKISMSVFPGLAADTRVSCGGTPQGDTWYFYNFGISATHGTGSWTINDWKYVGQDLFAERTYSSVVLLSSDTVDELTTLKLRHTPK